MQQFMTLFDQYPSSWQAAYTAFDVAARLNAKLISGVLLDHLGPDRAAEVMKEFETGARAARLEFESLLLPELLPLPASYAQSVNSLFIGKPYSAGWVEDDPLIYQLIEELPCPIWIVPQRREIQKIVVLIENGAISKGALQFGQFLARRWNQLPRYLAVSEHPDRLSIPRNTSRISPPYDIERLMLLFAAEHADLILIGKPGGILPVWEVCRQSNCLTVICPPVP
jgi:hypothetical protein